MLEEYRNKFLTYNDDIQGTAAVAIAGVLGGIKIQNPSATDLISEMRSKKFLFHGAGSANLGGASLLIHEGGVSASQVICTNSKGVIWKSPDGTQGSFKNDEQKALAQIGQPAYDSKDLVTIIQNFQPDVIVGAVGVSPGCFTQKVVEAMCNVQSSKGGGGRPIIFALSNPMTQAEITAHNCYVFSGGKAIFGSGIRFPPEEVNGKVREPGQVNNFFIFPGMSFGAMSCQARSIPERLFMISAEAVANSLDAHDIESESVMPHPGRIREVAHNVSTAVVLESQRMGLAGKSLGSGAADVRRSLETAMWNPRDLHRRRAKALSALSIALGPIDKATEQCAIISMTLVFLTLVVLEFVMPSRFPSRLYECARPPSDERWSQRSAFRVRECLLKFGQMSLGVEEFRRVENDYVGV